MRAPAEARARQLRAYADYHAAVADFRRRRQIDQENRISALLAEVIAALEPLGNELVCETCPQCHYALMRSWSRCPRCEPKKKAGAS